VAIPFIPFQIKEFYNGSTGVDKSKKRFDFEAEISKYYKSSELEQLIGSSARIKKNGVVNTMILNQLTYEKQDRILQTSKGIRLFKDHRVAL
jgi:hypothetical protein